MWPAILLILSFLFAACSYHPLVNNTPEVRYTEYQKKLYNRPYYVQSFPKIFETAFFDGTSVKQDTMLIQFYSIEIGKMKVESGKLTACDPINLRSMEPFTAQFPLGSFPVELSIARLLNQERVAYARIKFSDEPVTKWEIALYPGQKPIPLGTDSFYGYDVDGSAATIIDNDAQKVINVADEAVWSKIFNICRNGSDCSLYIMSEFNGHTIPYFMTGWGDGAYGTYIGYNADGKICRLLTDFALYTWTKPEDDSKIH